MDANTALFSITEASSLINGLGVDGVELSGIVQKLKAGIGAT